MQLTLERLTPAEDGQLRRLHCMEQLGARLAPAMAQLRDDLRRRDRRLLVREPQDRGVVRAIRIP